ncbi:type II/IV secretion system family protein [Clostridium argentinense CDC 2741]|uniref:Type II/IV secretion system family protein n=2 Tax=Clostridium argentinense TaxID=29341 RepID=A0A0C1U0M1_9CLOT|nr:ATPase, T2SS/T4P/T4SS family [Clostridium argentinense]ARC83098.1 hypothetical protein RSJ17_00145 [Clostridium argentinense]KIE45058.1 type II/IV secretion system family protein [Clostridium argentinense CDC 2741]NFF41350.1 pilus assembly protein CpaF [Clostridium argentinense]NFP51755.1 pilus assembly protein CpaF [Clostridium argentinense]NFP74275.1 pilus assembly protein CpaF [Clostridium argentinense]
MKFKSFFKKSKSQQIETVEKFSLDRLKTYVESTIDSLLRNSIVDFATEDDYEKQLNRRKTLIGVSKKCGLGDIGAKQYMKSFIMDLITQSYGVNEENIDYIFNFSQPTTVQDMFEIILHKYKLQYNYEALNELIKHYELDTLKTRENGEIQCFITDEDIKYIFSKETFNFTFEDKLEIITQRLYQDYKGLGVIDEIRDQIIDGLSLGISGVPIDYVGKLLEMEVRLNKKTLDSYKMSYESIWLYNKGKEIHLEFLGFGSQRELERICKIIYKFNDAKQLSRADGYTFNTMADLSRVAVYRPPFAEKWCAFIRKYDFDGDLDTIIEGENSEIVKQLSSFLAKSKQKISVTGAQGSGKTTFLVALIKAMYANTTLRVWEDFFEAYLSLKLPNRNILAIRKTLTISGEKGLDALKKSNGQVTIIPEAAEDEVIKYLIKVALVASESVMFTHHAEDADELVEAFRNSAINTGAFSDENIAEKQILRVLNFDIHLKTYQNGEKYGKRYIERITEFIRLDEKPFPDNLKGENDLNKKFDILYETVKMYFERMSGAKKYKAVNIVEYDTLNDRYIVKNNISQDRIKQIYNNLMSEDQEKFILFVKELDNMIQPETNTEIIPKEITEDIVNPQLDA